MFCECIFYIIIKIYLLKLRYENKFFAYFERQKYIYGKLLVSNKYSHVLHCFRNIDSHILYFITLYLKTLF